MNLTYVTLRTEDGLLNVPNSGMLAAAVGPWKKAVIAPAPEPVPAGAAGASTPTGNDQEGAALVGADDAIPLNSRGPASPPRRRGRRAGTG